MTHNKTYWTRVAKKVLLLLLSLLGIYLGFKLAIFYVPFLIGLVISMITEPMIRRLSKDTGLPRKISAMIVLIILFTVLIALISWGIVVLISESSALLQSLNSYAEIIYNKIMYYASFGKEKLPPQVFDILKSSTDKFITFITGFTTKSITSLFQIFTSIPAAIIYTVITILSTYFICTDKLYILDQIEHHFPTKWVNKMNVKIKNIISTLGNYLKAEVIMIFVSFVIVLIGLYIFKLIGLNIVYPLLAALGICFIDALPILGAGTVLVPWSVISALNGDFELAIALIILYIVILVARQFIEPKLVSNKIGIHPIFTLLSMYTGFKIIGIFGLIIGPIVLIIIKNLFENLIDDGIVKSILK